MQNIDATFLRTRVVSLVFCICVAVPSYSFAATTHTLSRGVWSLISVPADPGSGGTVDALFGDDLPAAGYGGTGSWVIYAFDATANAYRQLALSDTLQKNTGYWIVQSTAESIELDVPDSPGGVVGQTFPGCPAAKLCSTQTLVGFTNRVQWNLVGASIETPLRYADTRFHARGTACADGCTPEQATDANLIARAVYRFSDTGYERLDSSTVLRPWDGIWIAVLPNNASLSWVLPLKDDSSSGSADANAEKDAARLLMQASFGPTDESINDVMELGGPAQWIDAQMALPAQLHLPLVNQFYPNESGVQESRYEAFWTNSLHAQDQLRQRVAFALSQFLVISDKSTAIVSHADLAAAYYDVLLSNAFGNYRDLLEDITLSPAMGLYLSMLGNDKPDSTTGLRADENYAREVMQLFTIGLVGLNIDGSERDGVVTYTQPDVENLARALTGWFWNVDSWSSNTFEGWRPDRATLTQPMVAFAEHHDTDAKTVLGTTMPAGLSAEADLHMALDILFNHENVAPFVSKQLIKRLVTSNPSNGYVARVATIFNDNGAGVRGDMSAVIRAILMDEEARSPAFSERNDFGKLREPLLRYAHLWRAFGVTDRIKFKQFVVVEIPQIAPLTAPSVFNFYSPVFAPPGDISKADLVAPEFQINSGSSLNTVNTTLMSIVQDDRFKNVQTTLDLEQELKLIADTDTLLDHLDRLLTAGTMRDMTRQKLIGYIDSNAGQIPDERLLRDVVALVVTSAEFAIQR